MSFKTKGNHGFFTSKHKHDVTDNSDSTPSGSMPSKENEPSFCSSKQPADIRRAILTLALPALVEFGLMMIVQMVDMIQVGSLGPWAIAATGLAAQPTMLIFSVFSALVVGTTALVARAAGAGDRDYACRVTRQSFVIVLIMGVVITIIGILASGSIIRLMGQCRYNQTCNCLYENNYGRHYIRRWQYGTCSFSQRRRRYDNTNDFKHGSEYS